MEQRYDIYFSAQLREGENLEAVRGKLARLFNASEATLNLLFSGAPQLVKRDCDKATALKYKQAMENAGARPQVRRSGDEPTPAPAATATATATATAVKPAERPLSTTERIAALLGEAPPASPLPTTDSNSEPASGLTIAPMDGQLLRPEERSSPALRRVDTSGLSLEPDGALIPNLPPAAPLNPDISELELCEGAYDLSDCAPPAPDPPSLDLSSLALGERGGVLLQAHYRAQSPPPGPPTEHISLAPLAAD